MRSLLTCSLKASNSCEIKSKDLFGIYGISLAKYVLYWKSKQTFWNVAYFMVDSWRAAWSDRTLASTRTASASVVNLGEGRGQGQTVTLASSKGNKIWFMFGSPLLRFDSGFPFLFPFFSQLLNLFVVLLRLQRGLFEQPEHFANLSLWGGEEICSLYLHYLHSSHRQTRQSIIVFGEKPQVLPQVRFFHSILPLVFLEL